MSDARPQRRRRWLVGIGVALVLVIGAVVLLRTVVFRDRARAVTTSEAVDRFREQVSTTVATTTSAPPLTATPTTVAASTTSTTIAQTTLPQTTFPQTSTSTTVEAPPVALVVPGVYRYTTTGHEHVDALDGTTHEYPAETTITVVPAGCGAALRWDALKERWDDWALCATPDGIELQRDGTQYHEFFGQPDDEAVACDTTVLLVPAAPDVTLPSTQQSCTLAADPWLPTWDVLETSQRAVDGQTITVRHVRMTIEDDDQYPEHTVIDWYLASNGLPVEVSATKSSLSPSQIGAVQYDEEFHLELESITPLQ